ncbi:hypothetical protein [Prosthecobacter vanneervenii]|uniref:Uncharacterized protein n=1 Tax=Prosthecobacter vanneervenii TaxID=48466 RepID=A0A7W7Y9H5_9BACT|nr:hypothetical protein [Prosthecobacter vanneervenii]MBB5032123.1 hypothetical protein [Prosthecobacter vanneervenii]
MRGSPPIQIFLLGLMFVVLAVPLSHLTGTTTPVKAAVVAKVVEEKGVKGLVRVRYAHRPVMLSVKVGEKELVTAIEESPMEVDAPLPSTKDGVDVFVKATWPEGTPDTAVTVELEPDGLATRSETRWSSAASLDEVITFEWK